MAPVSDTSKAVVYVVSNWVPSFGGDTSPFVSVLALSRLRKQLHLWMGEKLGAYLE